VTAHSATTTYLPATERDGFTISPKIRVHIFGTESSDLLPIQRDDPSPHRSAVTRAAHLRLGKAPRMLTVQREHDRGFIFTFAT
jgi:hypothetical protein